MCLVAGSTQPCGNPPAQRLYPPLRIYGDFLGGHGCSVALAIPCELFRPPAGASEESTDCYKAGCVCLDVRPSKHPVHHSGSLHWDHCNAGGKLQFLSSAMLAASARLQIPVLAFIVLFHVSTQLCASRQGSGRRQA